MPYGRLDAVRKQRIFLRGLHPKGLMLPKLSDSPFLTREAEMPQTLLECDILKYRAIGLKGSPNRRCLKRPLGSFNLLKVIALKGFLASPPPW